MFGLRLSSAATSRFLRPATTSSTIRRSVSESSPSEAVRPPIRRSSERAFADQRRAPSRSKISAARCEGLAGGALVLRPALHGAEREERPGELERVRLLRRFRARRPPPRATSIACSWSPCAARSSPRQRSASGRRRCRTPRRARRAALSSRSASAKVADADQRLDPDRAGKLREDLVQLGDVRRGAARSAASLQPHRRRRARATQGRGSAGGSRRSNRRRRHGARGRESFSAPSRPRLCRRRARPGSSGTATRPSRGRSAARARSPRRRVAPPHPRRRLRPPSCARNIKRHDDFGIGSRRAFGDQLSSQTARASSYRSARASSRASVGRAPSSSRPPAGSLELDRTVEQVSTDAARCARTSARRRSRGCLRVGPGRRRRSASAEPRLRIANTVQVAAARRRSSTRAGGGCPPARGPRGPARQVRDCRGPRPRGSPSRHRSEPTRGG